MFSNKRADRKFCQQEKSQVLQATIVLHSYVNLQTSVIADARSFYLHSDLVMTWSLQ